MSIFLAVLTYFVTALLFSTACVLLKAWWLGFIGFIASFALAYFVYNKYEDYATKKNEERLKEEESRRCEEIKRRKEEMITSKTRAFLADPIAAGLVDRCIALFDFSIPNDLRYGGTAEKPSVQTIIEKAGFTWCFAVTGKSFSWFRYGAYPDCKTEFVFQKNGYSSQDDRDKLESLLRAVLEKVKDGYRSRYPSCKVSVDIDDWNPFHGSIKVSLFREVRNPNYGKADW